MDEGEDLPVELCLAVFSAPLDRVFPRVRALLEGRDEEQEESGDDDDGWTSQVFPVDPARATAEPLALQPYGPSRAFLFSSAGIADRTVCVANNWDLLGPLGLNLTKGAELELHRACWSRSDGPRPWGPLASYIGGEEVEWRGRPIDPRSLWPPAGPVYGIYIGPRKEAETLADPATWERSSIAGLEWSFPESVAAADPATVDPPGHLSDIVAPLEGLDFTESFGWSGQEPLQVTCGCGSTTFNVLTEATDDDTPFVAVECQACGRRHVLHDHAIHGYDARTWMKMPPCDATRTEPCASCGHADAEVVVSLETHEDEENREIVETSGGALEFGDLYFWFYAATRCVRCGATAEVASIECA